MSYRPVRTPFIITGRKFPTKDSGELSDDLTKMYFEVSTAINARVNGVYEQFQVNTGQQWFNNSDTRNRQAAFRQVFTLSSLTNGTNAIPTYIPLTPDTQFTNIYGTAANGSVSVALTPWIIGTPNDAPYLRVNLTNGNIEIITTTANWNAYSVIVVLEFIFNP